MEPDSSHSSIEERDESDQESFSSVASGYDTNPIVFPSAPPHLEQLYQIYQKNAKKMAKLTQSVYELENSIIQLERIKENKPQQSQMIELIDQGQEDSVFMSEYFQECSRREEETKGLIKTYGDIKMLVIGASLMRDKQTKDHLLRYLEESRNIVSTTVSEKHLTAVVKERTKKIKHKHEHYKLPTNLAQQNSERGSQQSVSSGKKNRHRSYDKQDEESVTIRIIQTQNLMHRIRPQKSQQVTEEAGSKDGIYVWDVKNEKEKFVSVTSLQKVKEDVDKMQYSSRVVLKQQKMNISLACYDPISESVFVLQEKGQVHRLNKSGNVTDSVRIDPQSIDPILLFQAIEGKLWIGTTLGVVRIYEIKQKLKLTQMIGCYVQQFHKVSSYCVSGKYLLFSMDIRLFQINIQTYSVKKIHAFESNILQMVNNYAISTTHIRQIHTGQANSEIKWTLDIAKAPKALQKVVSQRYKEIVNVTREKDILSMLLQDIKGNYEYMTF